MRSITRALAHHLGKLQGEIIAAIPALAPVGGVAAFGIAGDGVTLRLEVPDQFHDALLDPVLAAHDPTPPPPGDILGQRVPPRRAQTTNATATEIARYPVPANTELAAALHIRGVTADRQNLRHIVALVVVARAGGNVAVVQTRISPANATVIADHAIGTGGTWPLPTVAVDNAGSNRDVVIRVTGAASTTINWLLTGEYETFNPDAGGGAT